MARRPTLQQRIEEKAGQCRGLAMAMRDHADALGFLDRFERKVIEGWASSLDSIADGLTQAASERSLTQLRGLIGMLAVTAAVVHPLAEGSAAGISQAAAERYFASDKISACASSVLSDLPSLEAMTHRHDVEVNDSIGVSENISAETVTAKVEVPRPTMGRNASSSTSSVTGVASGRLGSLTATGVGEVTSAKDLPDGDEPSTPDARQIVRRIGTAEEHDEAPGVAPRSPDHVLEVADVHVDTRISPVTLEVHADDPTDESI